MITTMFRRVGNERIYIHGHLNNQEMAAYQLEGWRMHVPSKSSHKKTRSVERNKHGIPVGKGVGSREMQKVRQNA